ncbi:MAG TPA: hypothetical protein VMT53_19610 [Terriglobales bacterium]|nr:hypothetical protein [Terriglobales bacterium]
MKGLLAVALSFAICGSAVAEPAGQAASSTTSTTTRRKTARKASSTTSVAQQLEQMKQALEAQQQQIQQLRTDVQSRDQQIRQLEDKVNQSQTAATAAQSQAQSAASQAGQQEQTVSSLKSDVSDLKSNVTNTALAVQESQKRVNEELESPIALHYKGITITPGGFLAAESAYRQRALTADVNSPFNTVPFAGAANYNMSEFFASGRQSRISALVEGKLKNVKIGGYYEADWLSAGVTSNNNQSNSYTMRQRQLWGQAAFNNGFSFTGGQMWSLVTETKKGMDNRTEALPMTIDAQYHVGFSWARQYGLRVVKNFNNKVWLGASVEQPQAILTAHGNFANALLGGPGVGGGLYNSTANYSWNEAPDVVVKAAFEPGIGHYEVFGIFRQFRDRVYPCATASTTTPCGGLTGTPITTPDAVGAFNDSRTGGGVGVNARVSVYNKHIDLGVHGLFGDGVGRYGTSTLPDVTLRPDGTLALVKSAQGLGTIEWHSTKWDWYFNAGAEYAGRTAYSAIVKGKETGIGYGSPLFNNAGCFSEQVPGDAKGFTPGALVGCTGDTRVIYEGTVGFWYKIYNGSKGRVQFGPQYSYVDRVSWYGKNSPTIPNSPQGYDNMVFTSFRYYLP